MKICYKIWKSLICFLCVAVLLLGVIGCKKPAQDDGLHRVSNTEPLETDSLFAAPDSVVYIKDDFAHVEELSPAGQTAICAVFDALGQFPLAIDGNDVMLCGSVSDCAPEEYLDKFGGYALEYRYTQRRVFTGQIQGCTLAQTPVYDAVLWLPKGGTLLLYKDGQYFGFNDSWLVMHWITPFYAALEKILADEVGLPIQYPEYDGDYALHQVTSDQVETADQLWKRPDSIALVEGYPYIKTFSQENCETLYAAFETLLELSGGLVAQGDTSMMLEYGMVPGGRNAEGQMAYIAGYGVEFRYHCRQRFTGELALSDGTTIACDGVEYDAVLWMIDKNDNLTFILYKDGTYFGINDSWYVFDLQDDRFAAFAEAIKQQRLSLSEMPYD